MTVTNHETAIKPILKSKEFANLIGIHEDNVRKSRSTGYLLGRKAPAHLKLGRSVRYKRDDILNWIDQARVEVAA
ncbi:helix-turn-helix transcriptional regulator [Alteromonas australica]|uniref:helix-turn-helix transcriptional regulator n=1 Tax=Alteromonas australica TaxID=589873 RepID=UPI0005C847E8|nr:helix-turn-helix domain-containing protein [Alteromonas australica]|tara:strand:+ start:61 stop:285 length:225 start_codon:yes stop_codon:yes gene_type:complete